MNNGNTGAYAPYYQVKKRPACEYTKAERWYAAAAFAVSFLLLKAFTKATEGTGFGLMSSVAAIAVTVFNMLFCRYFGMRGSRTTKTIFVMNILLSLSFFICDNGAVQFLSGLLVFAGNAYYSYASYKEGRRSVLNNAFRSIFLSPFYEFGSLFGALFNKHNTSEEKKNKADIKKYLPIIAGLVLSIPVCVAVAVLLDSADSAFGSIFRFDFDWLEDFSDIIISNLYIIIMAVPLAMYIFSAVYSRAYKMHHEGDLDKLPQSNTRVLPVSMCAAFLTPLSVMYVLFVALQIIHAVSASVFKSPDFTYSEYAREGFFQLCTVAVINLAVISAVMFFSKEKRAKGLLAIFVTVFCALTLCLIVTALSKMLLYISIYGMTPKRIHTSVFMIYLFVMFTVLIVKQFKYEISFTKTGYCLAAAVLIALAFVPVDRLIARYNITHYMSGDISWMGSSAMYDLDLSAVPEFASLIEDDTEAGGDARYFFNDRKYLARSCENMTAWDFNIPRYIAGKTIMENQPNNGGYFQ